MSTRLTDPDAIARALAEPFPPDRLGWKPQSVSGNRALAIAYIDARDVMDRLDAVVGVEHWTDEYEMLPDGSALCRLRVRFGSEWILKVDVGGESDQKDQGDRHKAAVSDALKRAAVKFGVGRYLYSLAAVWCDYDPVKKQLLRVPTLPAWALPARPAEQPVEPCVNDEERVELGRRITLTAGRLGEKVRPVADRLLAHLGCRGVGQIPAGRYQDALAFLADQKPADRTADRPNINFVAYLLRIDERLRAAARTWTKALAHCKIDTPAAFEEPENEKDLETLARWLSREQAARVEADLTPARKGA